jgi:hypothetical protein
MYRSIVFKVTAPVAQLGEGGWFFKDTKCVFEPRERLAVDGQAGTTLQGCIEALFFNVTAPVAQLDRASGFEPEGREFESLRAHQYKAHGDAVGPFTLVLSRFSSTFGFCETTANSLANRRSRGSKTH